MRRWEIIGKKQGSPGRQAQALPLWEGYIPFFRLINCIWYMYHQSVFFESTPLSLISSGQPDRVLGPTTLRTCAGGGGPSHSLLPLYSTRWPFGFPEHQFLPLATAEQPLAALSATGQLCQSRAPPYLQDSRTRHLGFLQGPP